MLAPSVYGRVGLAHHGVRRPVRGRDVDGVLMLSAYDWAFVKPILQPYDHLRCGRRHFPDRRHRGARPGRRPAQLVGWFWDGIAALNANFSNLGFLIIGVFIAIGVGSNVSSTTLR